MLSAITEQPEKPDNPRRCSKCGYPLDTSEAWSEDGALDFPWCDNCIDFTDAVLRHEPRKR